MFALMQRVELRVGLKEQMDQAARRRIKLETTVTKRDAQADIFGTRTIKELRSDKARLEKAASTSSNPVVRLLPLLFCALANT